MNCPSTLFLAYARILSHSWDRSKLHIPGYSGDIPKMHTLQEGCLLYVGVPRDSWATWDIPEMHVTRRVPGVCLSIPGFLGYLGYSYDAHVTRRVRMSEYPGIPGILGIFQDAHVTRRGICRSIPGFLGYLGYS